MNPIPNLLTNCIRVLLLLGPGLFCVGYTIGTGAVTKLAAAGAAFDLQLLWVLPAGALVFWALMEGFGRYAIVAGGTALNGLRTHVRGGRWLALLILAGVVLGQWTGLPVLVRLVSQLACDGFRLFVPSAPPANAGDVIAVGSIILFCVWLLLAVGRYSVLERVMMALVAVMVAGFGGAALLIRPVGGTFALALAPSMPSTVNGSAALPAVVGTLIAGPTFLLRPLLLRGKGWNGGNAAVQQRDAGVAALIGLAIGACVMACAAGARGSPGFSNLKIFDVIAGIESTAGRVAAELFLCGAIGAGLSSILPMALILPVLVSDYCSGELQLRTRGFRTLTTLACVVALFGPILGDGLIPLHRIASQAAQVFVLPLVVGGMAVLLNRKEIMGEYTAGFWLNAGLAAALTYALFTAWHSIAALGRMFT